MSKLERVERSITDVTSSLAVITRQRLGEIAVPINIGGTRGYDDFESRKEPLAMTLSRVLTKTIAGTMRDLTDYYTPYSLYNAASSRLADFARISDVMADEHPADEWRALTELIGRKKVRILGRRVLDLANTSPVLWQNNRHRNLRHPELQPIPPDKQRAHAQGEAASAYEMLKNYTNRRVTREIDSLLAPLGEVAPVTT